MGKIRKHFSQEKHGATLSNYISEFIRTAESLPLYKLRSHLASFPSRWPFPRGDIYHWITLLNRFDEIFEQFISIYALDKGPQSSLFGRQLLLANKPEPTQTSPSPHQQPDDSILDGSGYEADGDRELIEAIVTFTRILHENCGNRSLYASSGRLSHILNTASSSLQEITLRLLHRLAQRYTAQRMRSGHPPYLGNLRPDLLSVHFAVDLQKLQALGQGSAETEASVGDATSFEKQHGLTPSRLLAIACLAQVYPESTLVDKVLKSYADKPRHQQFPQILCELIRPPSSRVPKVSRPLQTLALLTLESLTCHKTLGNEVCTALNVSVNHGPLASALRQAVNLTIDEVGDDFSEEDADWLSELFELSRTLPKTNQRAVEGLISAGLIDMLVEILKAKGPKAEKMHEPAMQFMSSYAWMVPDALTSLVNVGGLDVMSELLVHHIARAMLLTKQGEGLSPEHRTQATDYQIPFHQQQSLRTIFKFIHNMLSVSTGFDRLMRNLLEGSDVLASLRTVIGNSKVFGSNVWTNCVHVFSTFINNEPTSFTAIAEAGIPRAILESIVLRPLDEKNQEDPASSGEAMQEITATPHELPSESVETSTEPAGGILPALEAVNAVPDAFGAMCLNEAGFQQLEKSGALGVLFGVFISPAHVKAFSNAAGTDLEKLGSSIEQLHRHNPSLAVKIKDLVSSTATRLAKLVSSADASGLVPDARTLDKNGLANAGSSQDVDMKAAQTSSEAPKSSPTSGAPSTPASSYVGVYTKFLSAIFGRNNTFSARFTEKGGLDSLLAMAGAPGLFKESLSPPQRFADVIRHMVEQKPHLVLPPLIARIQEHLNKLTPLLEHSSETSYMLPLANATQSSQLQWSEILDREARLQSLVQIQLLVPSLTKGLTPLHTSHPSRHVPPTPLAQVNVSDMLCPLIESLGRLQGKILWEQQLCAQARKNDRQSRTMNGQSQGRRQSTTSTSQGANPQASSDALPTTLPSDDKHRSGNVDDVFSSIASIASKYLYAIPGPITDLFFRISSSMVPRRLSAESFQRQQVFKMGDQIGQALLKLLIFNFSPDTPESTILAFRKATYDCIKGSLSNQRDFGHRAGPQLQLIVIKAFMNKGCIGAMGKIIRHAMDINIRPKADAELEGTRRQLHEESTAVMTNFLSLLTTISSFTSLSQGSHTDTLRSRERPELVGPEYITASQLSVEIRFEIARSILPIWTSLEPELVDSSVIKNLSKVVEGVLDVTGDIEAFRRGNRPPKSASNISKTWTPRSSQLASLEESAYSRELAVEALYRCNDSEASAREYCSYFQESDTRMRHPPPNQDVHLASLSADSDPTQTTLAPLMPQINSVPGLNGSNLDWDDSAEDAEMDLSTNTETVTQDSSAPPSNDLADRPPAMLMDVLSDVANTILQDPTNAAHPSATEQSNTPAETETEQPKTETISPLTTVEDLDEQRQEVRASLMDRCLTICGSHDDVTFEMSDLIARSIPPGDEAHTMRAEVSSTLVMSLVSYSEAEDLTPEAKKLSGIAHLLGIILQGPEFFDAAREELQESFSSLVALVRVRPDQKPVEHAPWIPQILLILERVLVEDLQPQHIHWVPPPIDNPLREQAMTPVPEMMISKEAGTNLFQLVIDLLPRVGKELHFGQALTRVLVVLTRSRYLAKSLSQTPNMHKFLSLVKQLAPVMSERFKSSVLLILRHIVEDDDTIRRLIRSDIREMLERPPRPVDTAKFCKELYHAVLRSPELFVEVTNEICEVSRLDRQSNPSGPQIITLKKIPDSTDATSGPSAAGAEITSENAVTQNDVQRSAEKITPDEKTDEEAESRVPEMKPPVVEHPDGVIHLLLIELLNFQNIEDKTPTQSADRQSITDNSDVEMTVEQTTNTNPPGPNLQPTSSATQKEHFKVEEHPIFLYRCFILQALTELLASYNRSKVEFINFSRKADPLAATPSKPRSGILNYLLNALLPTGTIEHPSGIEGKKKSQTSNQAIGAIVALCSRTTESGSTKQRDLTTNEDEPELAFVRKFVLEHALKAYKDCMSSSEPIGAKYSKLLALADLFNRMLAGRPAMHPGYRGRAHAQEDSLEPSNKQIAKIMFEKNFAGALTSSMSDIDPKLVGGNRLIKYVLRPLKLLTHTAIELSIAGDPSTSPGTSTDDDEISSASSMSEAGNDREETPDLYRHSTLGMFEPGREEDPSSSESEGEEQMYEEGYGDEMEYEEEDDDPNEGDVVSDEDDDEHMEGVGPVEGLHGDVGIDVEIELDDGDSGSDDEGEDEDMGEDDDDEDDGEDDEEDEDEENLDEITGDHENDSLGDGLEDDGLEDDADMDEEGGHATFADMLAATEPPWVGDDEPSDAELEDYNGTNLDIDPHMPHEHLQHDEEGIDLESAGDEEDDEEDDYEEEYLYQQDVEGELPARLEYADEGLRLYFEMMQDDLDHITESLNEFDTADDDEIPPYFSATFGTANSRRPTRPPGYLTSRLDPAGHRAGMFDPEWRDALTGQPRGNEGTEGQNPLLNRDRRPDQAGSTRNGGPASLQLPNFASMFPRLEDLGPGSAHDPDQYRYLTTLIDALGRGGPGGLGPGGLLSQLQGGADIQGPAGIQIRMGGPGGRQDLMEIAIPSLPPHHHHHHHHHHHDHSFHSLHSRLHGPTSMPHSDPALAVAFQSTSTAERWQNEARMVFGGLYASAALRVVNSIHRILVPLAMDAENQRKQKREAEEKKRQEEREKELKEQEEKERIERKEREAREAVERAEAEAAAASTRETQTDGENQPSVESMEGVETAGNADEVPPEQTAQGTAAPTADRVYTNIRGSQLDITDLGIDAAYLEALPEDMREEVIMGRYTEQRSEAAAAGADASAVDNEFLQALPEDIREEILAQERQERRRRERQEQRRQQAVANGQPTQAEDMDPASFMASLDPVLRQQVLAEADDEMLNSLPAELAAEARALGGHHRRRALDPTRIMEEITGSGPGRDRRQTAADGQRQRRPIVQMLDKASVNTLLRLMFLPVQSNARQTLNGILRNASGNHQSRGEIVSGLLQVLQDGSQDHGAIEKSFSQMTNRAKQSSATKTPIKRVTSNETPAPSDAAPRLVIGNCLASLIFLTQSIPHIPKFFLTEHEIIVGSKLKNKAKGKARDTKASRIPLNALLGLLDRDVVIADALLVEQLAGLLQNVTSPLVQLLKKERASTSESANTDQAASGLDQSSSTAAPTVTPGQPQQITLPLSTDGAGQSTTEDVAAQISLAETSSNAEAKPVDAKPATEAKKPFEPPEIPEENLRLIINIMTARDCNSKSFRDALSTVNNLSSIPGARDVFGQELVTRARQLANSIMADLSQLTTDFNKAGDAMEAQNMALSKFSPSGSDQAKFSRVLTAVDYLFDAKNAQDKAKQNGVAQAGNELLSSLHEDPTFSKVWIELTQTLTAAHNILAQGQQSDKTFLNVATILLPLIESLMVVSRRLDLKDVRSLATAQKLSAPTTPAAESTMKQIFFKFTDDHRKILNDLVRQNPKLMSGTFAVLIKNSSVLEFDNKRNYFSRRLHQRSGDARAYPHASLGVNVRRDQVFTDSYRSLFFKKPEEMKYGKLNIRFHNEEGVDAGGVTREWFQVLSRQMFDANFALFNPVAADRTTFHPNPLSYVNEESLPYFQFIGRIIGKALYENRVLDCHFSRAVYKQLLGRQVSLKDMETIDLDYAKSLQWMLDNDITDIITETFSVTSDNFGVIEVIDLQPNGWEIPVTDENKHEYVRLVIEYKLTGSVREQLEAFLKGFHDIVPADLVAIFDEGELELLISGLPDIDVSDWKANTDYQNYNASSAQIQWFWRAVRSFGKEERAKLLQFITGTGKVPLNGFKELEGMNGFTHFSIHKDFGSKDRLPSSHTCFNQLDLPEYDSYESLRKNLYTAMTTGGDYFGFA